MRSDKFLPLAMGVFFLVGNLLAQSEQASSPGSKNEAASAQQDPEASQDHERPKRVRVSAGVANALLKKKVAPRYPHQAREKGIQGVVALQVLINQAGDVADVRVISGDPMFADVSVEAVKQWKYKPYLLSGQAVEVETVVKVSFNLSP